MGIYRPELKDSYKVKKVKGGARSRAGCFCCRKRKIKCDGLKVGDTGSCGRCLRSSYICVWPTKQECSLPHKNEFKLTKLPPGSRKNTEYTVTQFDFTGKKPSAFVIKQVHPTSKSNAGLSEVVVVKTPQYDQLDDIDEIGQLDFSGGDFNILNNQQQEEIAPLTYDILDDLEYFNQENLMKKMETDAGRTASNSTSNSENDNIDPEMVLDDSHLVNSSPSSTEGETGVEKYVQETQEDVSSVITTVEDAQDSLDEDQSVIELEKTTHLALFCNENDRIEKEIKQDALFRRYLVEVGNSISYLSVMKLDTMDSLLFDAFTNGFIPMISPQFAHAKLQPGSVFVPPGVDNNFLRTMFLSCGASLLSSSGNDEMKLISVQKTTEAVTQLLQLLTNEELAEKCDLLMIFFLLFYLKQKFQPPENKQNLTLCIVTATEVIKLWAALKEHKDDYLWHLKFKEEQNNIRSYQLTRIEDLITTLSNLNNTMSNDEHLLAFGSRQGIKRRRSSNMNLDSADLNNAIVQSNNEFELLPYQRTILESFIYNYTQSLFHIDSDHYHLFTSPYEIFDTLRGYLSQPIFDTAVPWMNNPVVGASVPIVELQAKIVWMSHQQPFTPDDIKEISNLMCLANFYTPPILPSLVHQKEPEAVKKKLMESCYWSAISAKAVLIYGMKLLNRDLPTDDAEVQRLVNCCLGHLEKLSIHCNGASVSLWGLTVVGSCVLDPVKQDYIRWRIQHFAETFKVTGFTNSLEIQEVAWAGEGLDALFDERLSDKFTL